MQKGTSGKDVGKTNAEKLRVWLSQQTSLPGHGGKPNKTEIARLAGLRDRQPLMNNSECKRLLGAAVKRLPIVTSEGSDSEKSKLERKIRELETRNDKEVAENCELKRKLRKLRHIEQILETGRRFVP